MFNYNKTTKINIFKDAAKTIWSLFRGYRKYIAVMGVLGILSGLVGAIGINALIPLFSFFADGETSAGTDFVSRFIKKSLLAAGIPFTLPSILALICVLFILKAAMLYVFDYIKIHIKTKYQQDMMNDVFKKSLYADWSYLMKQKIGYLETVIRTDVAVSARLMDVLSALLITVSNLTVYTVVAFNISQAITVMTLAIGLALFLALKPLLALTRKYSKETEELNKKVARHINEHISGIKTIKANGVEGEVGALGGELFEKFRFLQIRTFLTRRMAIIMTEPMGIIFISGVVAFAYYKTSYNLGALAAVIYLIKQIFAYAQNILGHTHMINESIPYAQEMMKYREKAEAFQEKKQQKGNLPFTFKKSLNFENVTFEYENGKRALDNVSFEIKKGEMVGIIGPSGGGKSTAFDLLLRFFEPTKGGILLDGKDIKNISLKSWRRNIAYVPQDIFLLNDTIGENIRFRDKNITEKDIIAAAKDAQIYDFIRQLPEGMDTMVGERGIMLSGGQRQRIVIARALARKPQILLLDEATSALDAEAENAIKHILENKKGEITILAIAHRMSTVRNADKLIAIENGKIIELGSPEELLGRKGTYFSKIYGMEK